MPCQVEELYNVLDSMSVFIKETRVPVVRRGFSKTLARMGLKLDDVMPTLSLIS